jgi:hypothetical protein
MTYAVVANLPGGDWETYEKITAEAGVQTTAPEGLIVHVAGQTETGTRIIDVWESKAAYDAFTADRLVPAIERLGVPSGRSQSEELEVQHLLRG